MILHLDTLSTLFLTVICLLMGIHLKKRIEWLQRFCIPSPVIGGFLVSLIIWGLKSFNLAEINFDTSLQTFLMVAFFTTIGIDGSFRILKSGGRLLFIYLFICWFVVIFQDTFGAGLAHLLGVDPVIGIMAGGVSLTGGPWRCGCLWWNGWRPWCAICNSCSNCRGNFWPNYRKFTRWPYCNILN
ncbi:sodium/glutamate symporter [Providencia huaxiensis]|nr:sodium/glutamate symporter [Providencia huaxiensis]MDI7241128.1 sodium/glutamate symporter [Providencia huaxiensis]